MIDIKLIRENKELVKENLKKKYQEHKLPMVDEIYELDIEFREFKVKNDELRNKKNKLSDAIGGLMRDGKKEEAEKVKQEVKETTENLLENEEKEKELAALIKEKMMNIPQIMHESVPLGKDDTENVENERFGEATIPDFEVPHHEDIIKDLCGIDKEASARTSGSGFYYLIGDVARLHTAMLSYARDYMIEKGFTYAIPPFMVRGDVVSGVMSFEEMDNMMYKLEGEDLYLIGTSEHSMIGMFKDQILEKEKFPIKMTSYSPCFRKEVGAHGIEERGIYRVHQFEKQEMIIICDETNHLDLYEDMWNYTVEVFRNLNVPVRTLECCSGDLADLKVKSCDVEAWSPRQQKYFEVGSCSTLGDAQARRLGIRMRTKEGIKYAYTLNNTVVASPRGLIGVIENNLNEDGSVTVPEALRPYMGGLTKIEKVKKD